MPEELSPWGLSEDRSPRGETPGSATSPRMQPRIPIPFPQAGRLSTDAPHSQHLLLPQSCKSLAEPGKRPITITPPAPCRAVLLPLGCGAAACHLLLVAATGQGEEVAPCSALAPLGAPAGRDAQRDLAPRSPQTTGLSRHTDTSSQGHGARHRGQDTTGGTNASFTSPVGSTIHTGGRRRQQLPLAALCAHLGALLTNEPCWRFQPGFPS